MQLVSMNTQRLETLRVIQGKSLRGVEIIAAVTARIGPVHSSHIYRILKDMVDKGLLECRGKHYRLTPNGEQELEEIRKLVERIFS